MLALVIKTPPQERYITKLAEQAGLTRQNIKRQLDVLDKNEYIFIYPSNNDPRRLMVALTDKTKEKFYSKDDLDTSTLELLFQFFTSDELESFFANIDKLSTCLDAFICGKDGKPE